MYVTGFLYLMPRHLLLTSLAAKLSLEPVPGCRNDCTDAREFTGQDQANQNTDKNPNNEHDGLLGQRVKSTSVWSVILPEVAIIDEAV